MSTAIKENVLSDKVRSLIQNLIQTLGITNSSLNVRENNNDNQNYIGVIIKLQIADDKGKKINIVVKRAPKSPLFRSFFPIQSIFLRESYIYDKVLTEFTKLQIEKNVKQPFGYFTKYYGAVLDLEEEAILLEDVHELGYKNLKNEGPMSHQHALLVVQELGKLHAVSFAMRDRNKEMFSELLQNTEEAYFTKILDKDRLDSYCDTWIGTAQETLDKEQEKVIYNKIGMFKDQYYKVLIDILTTPISDECAVICHGDVWIGNLLFKYSTDGKPESVCFLDWQMAHSGSPALDISHFLFTCTDKPTRDLYYEDLINAYYTSFCEHLQQLGGNPKTLFPMETLRKHLKKFSVFGLCVAMQVTWLNLNAPKNNHIDFDISTNEDLEKFTTASKGRRTEEYTKRMRDIILDYFQLGYEL